eukprot:scaffold286_cov247-Pinguiococcus_pyrenoidosus.AAC.7
MRPRDVVGELSRALEHLPLVIGPIDDLVGLRQLLGLVLREAHAHEVAEGDALQRVAAAAHLLVHLEATTHRFVVITTEESCEQKPRHFHIPSALAPFRRSASSTFALALASRQNPARTLGRSGQFGRRSLRRIPLCVQPGLRDGMWSSLANATPPVVAAAAPRTPALRRMAVSIVHACKAQDSSAADAQITLSRVRDTRVLVFEYAAKPLYL